MYDLSAKQNSFAAVSYSPTESIVYLGLFIWPAEHQFYFLGQRVDLSPSLFTTIHYLMRDPHVFHSRDKLCEQINRNLYDRSIDGRIKNLRIRLRQTHSIGAQVIIAKSGVGYRLWQRSDFEHIQQNADR